jgi:hypothetical protein
MIEGGIWDPGNKTDLMRPGANSHRISTARFERTPRLDKPGKRKQLLRMARNKRCDA